MIDVSINNNFIEIDLNVVFEDNIIDATIIHDGPVIDIEVCPQDTNIETSITTELSPVDIGITTNQTIVDTTINISNPSIDISIEPGGGSGEIPQGGLKRQVLKKVSDNNNDYSWSYSYEDFLINVEYTGIEDTLTSGQVLTGSIDGSNVYRFISDTINNNGYPTEDSFYKDFNGTILTNLIKTRG